MRRLGGPPLRLALGLCLSLFLGCAPTPKYIVERSPADFTMSPDFREQSPEQLTSGIASMRSLFADDDGDASVELSIGAYQLALGRTDSAEASFRRAIAGFESQARALPPKTTASYGTIRARADGYIDLGITLAARHDYSGAREEFARASGAWLASSPEALREKTRLARYDGGIAWELEGNPGRAIREYDAVLAASEWTRARYARACARAAAGQLDSALVDFERVVASHAEERRLAPYHVGRIRELRADTTRAIAAYESFVEAQTWGLLSRLRVANPLLGATREEMIAGLEQSADERTHGLYRDAQSRILRLRRPAR